ncbi:MAG: hypothetical protein K0B87_09150 [Candidatus Syntrophosphaera sp.]|nr:hypothetical protein [Candidatus Syntrophosphaera sp.]
MDSAGNIYVTGWFKGTAVFGAFTLNSNGYRDVFVAKADPDGNWLWANSAGGPGVDCGNCLDVDASGNSFVTGYFYASATFGGSVITSAGLSDIFVAKLDPAGNWVWASRAGGPYHDFGNAITVGGAGLIFVTGSFESIASFGSTSLTSSGASDIFLTVLGELGAWLVAIRAGGPGWDAGQDVIRDSFGNIYVTGSYEITATFYTSTLNSYGADDIFLAKFDPAGLFIGVMGAGSVGGDYGWDLAADSAGNVFLAGSFYGTAYFGPVTLISNGLFDVFVAKILPAFVLEFAVAGGGPQYDKASGVNVDSAGNIYVTGYYNGTATFGSHVLPWRDGDNIFAAKLDPAGNWLWVQWAGGNDNDLGCDIEVDGAGNSFVTGSFISTAEFGPFLFSYPDEVMKMFLAKLRFGTNIPLSPQNLSISAIEFICYLTWSPVTQDINGYPLTPDHYQVFWAEDPEGPYTPVLPLATNCWWFGSNAQPAGFYRVTAVVEE